MDAYDSVAHAASRRLTLGYSTSFGLATRLFDARTRRRIYDVYGLVRLADEIVDTYATRRPADARAQLDALEQETYHALRTGYSTNMIVHAFAQTARETAITRQLIRPFFASMRTDLTAKTFVPTTYAEYIYGSAEVVGLLCLKVFCGGSASEYKRLQAGARALGAAFQKVNFLRDLADDHARLGRFYFPRGSFEEFDDAAKQVIVAEITADFAVAAPAIGQLPPAVRPAVRVAYRYYHALLDRLASTPAAVIRTRRIRISDLRKISMLAPALLVLVLRKGWR